MPHPLTALAAKWRGGGRTARAVSLAAASVLLLATAIVGGDLLFPPPLEKAATLSPLIVDHEGRWVRAFTTPDGRWRYAADLDEIDPVFVERVVAVEDKRFWRHAGVDLAAVSRAGFSAVKAGRIVSGASTITMQTARLLEPRPRTLGSKFVEMIRALQIERRLTKREILELYLTLAPYGGNLEGVRAASLAYFGKEPLRLTDAEQALLIALPQAPESRRPDRHAKAARAGRAEILAEFGGKGLLTAARVAEADDALLPQRRRAAPRAAYHLSSELAASGEGAHNGVIRATLDLPLQREAERLAERYAAGFADDATTALLVIDNRTRAVRALVGSSSLDAAGGWIDLTTAQRSPGSTLKPFIYGLAFENGVIGPSTVIEDMPQSFDGYAPENFDRTFRGEVSAADALQHSLNLPAVRLLDRLGAAQLAALIRAAGVAIAGPKRAEREFGLSLALGGAGVTMRDIGVLYAALANDGAAAPLVWTEGGDEAAVAAPPFHLFSAQSAAHINAILADAPALEGRAPSALSLSAPRIAYKTGTSYGFRDAWSAGHAGAYTVVAWVGRADGAARPGATGRNTAAPLLFNMFDAIARLDPDGAADRQRDMAPDANAVARLSPPRRETPPEIVFPRDGIELFAGSAPRGFSLAARGGAGDYRWYVSGETVDVETTSGRPVWRPKTPGFYDITVVDADGRSARAKVRVAQTG